MGPTNLPNEILLMDLLWDRGRLEITMINFVLKQHFLFVMRISFWVFIRDAASTRKVNTLITYFLYASWFSCAFTIGAIVLMGISQLDDAYIDMYIYQIYE